MGASKKKEVLDLQKDDALTAVVIADSFDSRFKPLTEDKPRCLLPLATKPILGYTLEFLKSSGVQEIYVYCTSNAQEIKKYLDYSGWANRSVSTLTNEGCRSLGDAMRDVDGKAIIRGDFILVAGDTVSNVDLRPIVEEHRDRVKKDKNCSMTLLYRRSFPSHQLRTLEDDLVVAADGSTGRILHYERTKGSRKIRFPVEIFDSEPEVDICFDLLDPFIAVCSQSIPPLFSDKFDCQTLDGFVRGVLEDDLLDNTIYMSVLDEGYAARVASLHHYLAISRDVMNRWLYPIAPDMGSKEYSFQRNNVYIGADTKLMKGSILDRDVVLGRGCQVGEDSRVSASCIDANVNLESRAVVTCSVIMDRVRLGPGACVEGSVLAPGVVLGSGVKVNQRCILAEGVEVDAGVEIPADTRLVAKPRSDGFSDDEGEENVTSLYGSKAFPFVPSDDGGDSDSDDGVTGGAGEKRACIWGQSVVDAEKESNAVDDETSSEESDFEGMDEVAIGDIMLDEDAKVSVFHQEVLESLQRGAKENLAPENLQVEINSSRHAYNATWSNVIHSVTTNVLFIAAQKGETLKGQKLLKEVKALLSQFSPLLRTYCKSDTAEIDCLLAVEEFSADRDEFADIAKNVIHALYDDEIVQEKSILQWFHSEQKFPEVRQKVKPLIEWLEEDDESSED